MNRILSAAAALTFLLLTAGGCAPSAPVASRKTTVDKYVSLHGNDPNSLRDVTLSGDRRGFGVIGQNDPKQSTDAKALLLTHQEIAGRPWFVYLVGIVKQQKVDDIRLAARTQEPGKPATWAISKPDPHAVKLYKEYNEGLWRRSQPDKH